MTHEFHRYTLKGIGLGWWRCSNCRMKVWSTRAATQLHGLPCCGDNSGQMQTVRRLEQL